MSILQFWKPAVQLEAKLQKRLISLVLMGSTITAVTVTALFSYAVVRKLLLTSLETNAMHQVQKAGDEIDEWLATLMSEVKVLADSPRVRTLGWSVAEPYLQLELDQMPDFVWFSMAKADGTYYNNKVGLVKNRNLRDRRFFQRAMAGVTLVDDPVIGRTSGLWNAHIATPIWSVPRFNGSQLTNERARIRARSLAVFNLPPDPYQKPRPIGVLSGTIPVVYLSQVVERISSGEGSYAFALDSKGNPLAHPNQHFVEKPNNFLTAANPSLAKISQAMVNRQRGIKLVQISGKWVYVAYLPLQKANWSLGLVIPRENLERQLIPLNLLASVLFIILAMAMLFAIRLLRLFEQTRTQAQQLQAAYHELQNTQAQLIQTEKMSSLGQMVAGIAHEINNPVNFIYGNITPAAEYTQDLLRLLQCYQQHYPNPTPELQAEIEAVELDFIMEDFPKLLSSLEIGANRIREIVLSLRTFSRLDEAEVKAVDIHEGMDSTIMILQHRLKAKPEHPEIRVIREYGKLPLVECFAGQLNQVFMNIIVNAIDALEEANQKRSPEKIKEYQSTITIRTEVTHSPASIVIRIIDNGLGIPEHIQKRLFDPFFTTKSVGKGTGLGLSISYQIVVEKHKGRLECYSTLGVGTEFIIVIPQQLTNC
ncbi:MAG: sensor histidine kinase [Stigonema ocellatum SAG 48.90 = DSM 106950]|nr:sensor histidine kinase [Stigonema ocellatum SAG 48.90 = DSM 106950]